MNASPIYRRAAGPSGTIPKAEFEQQHTLGDGSDR